MPALPSLKPFALPVLLGWAAGGVAFLAASLLTDAAAGGAEVEAGFQRVAARLNQDRGYSSPASDLVAMPLFARAAVTDVAAPEPVTDVKLVGVSRTPRRRAALLSVNGATPVWVELGKTDGDMQVLSVGPSTVKLKTSRGDSELRLFGQVPPQPAAQADPGSGPAGPGPGGGAPPPSPSPPPAGG